MFHVESVKTNTYIHTYGEKKGTIINVSKRAVTYRSNDLILVNADTITQISVSCDEEHEGVLVDLERYRRHCWW